MEQIIIITLTESYYREYEKQIFILASRIRYDFVDYVNIIWSVTGSD